MVLTFTIKTKSEERKSFIGELMIEVVLCKSGPNVILS